MTGAAQIEALQVPVSGGDLAVFRLGVGPPVVAVHGITSSSRAWLAVARALAGRASLLAVDLRGRGRSNALPGPYGLAAHVADLVAVLDAFGLERAVLAGHSLGAYVVARFAVEHAERAQAVVLVDGGLAIPGAEGVEPQQFADAFLGPALARLQMASRAPRSTTSGGAGIQRSAIRASRTTTCSRTRRTTLTRAGRQCGRSRCAPTSSDWSTPLMPINSRCRRRCWSRPVGYSTTRARCNRSMPRRRGGGRSGTPQCTAGRRR
jgi:pimeloyl-ACP methyl ester carboxylesterase